MMTSLRCDCGAPAETADGRCSTCVISVPYRAARDPDEVSATGFVVRRLILDTRGRISLSSDVRVATEAEAYEVARQWEAATDRWHVATVHPA
jgi:hypothetical protein